MNKDELIVKQQLEIEGLKKTIESVDKIKDELNSKFYGIGQPLNDNVLRFNNKQLGWAWSVDQLVDKMYCI